MSTSEEEDWRRKTLSQPEDCHTTEMIDDDERYPNQMSTSEEEEDWRRPMTIEPTGWMIKEVTYNQDRQGRESYKEQLIQENESWAVRSRREV